MEKITNHHVCTAGQRSNIDMYFSARCIHAEVLNENERKRKD